MGSSYSVSHQAMAVTGPYCFAVIATSGKVIRSQGHTKSSSNVSVREF
jgi:hypothetical protein